MSTFTITLPDDVREFVDEQVAAGQHESADAYVRDVIEKERLRAAEKRLEALLLEGLEGERTRVTPEYWEDVKKRMLERHSARRSS